MKMVDRGSLETNKNLAFIDPRIRSQAPIDGMTLLSPTFQPGNWDVICQRGKESYDHVGNRRFRICIENNLLRYSSAKTKLEKSLIVMSIVDNIRENATQQSGAGFVKQDLNTKSWYEVGDKLAREKVGQALRELIKQRKGKTQETKKTAAMMVHSNSPERKLNSESLEHEQGDEEQKLGIDDPMPNTPVLSLREGTEETVPTLLRQQEEPTTSTTGGISIRPFIQQQAVQEQTVSVARRAIHRHGESPNSDDTHTSLSEFIGLGRIDAQAITTVPFHNDDTDDCSISSSIFSADDEEIVAKHS